MVELEDGSRMVSDRFGRAMSDALGVTLPTIATFDAAALHVVMKHLTNRRRFKFRGWTSK